MKWLPSSFAKNPDAVEKVFCEPFAKLPCVFPQDDPRHLEDFSPEKVYVRLLDLLSGHQQYKLKQMAKRAEHNLSIKLDIRPLVYLSIVTINFASFVMYLAYIQYWAKKNYCPSIDFEILTTKIFPNGFPIEEDLKNIWYSQKIDPKSGSDNLLDHPDAYRSIQF